MEKRISQPKMPATAVAKILNVSLQAIHKQLKTMDLKSIVHVTVPLSSMNQERKLIAYYFLITQPTFRSISILEKQGLTEQFTRIIQ